MTSCKCGRYVILICLAFAGQSLAALPTDAKTAKQVAVYLRTLKSCPIGNTPYAKVERLVTKLAKLDPAKASPYLRLGVTRIAQPGAAAGILRLQKITLRIVRASDLSPNKIVSIVKTILKPPAVIKPPPPPFSPYSA